MADFELVFADGADAYTFANVTDFKPAFSRMQNMITSLPGVHGGYDQNHAEEDRSREGRLDISFVLETDTMEAMQSSIDEVSALPYLGRQKLYYQPQGTYTQRWCYARVSDIQMGMSAVDGLVYQQVRARLAVSDPFWRHDEESSAVACSGTATVHNVTNSGNAVALVRIVISCGAAQTCENPLLRRYSAGGFIVDYLLYTGVVGNNETLTFDAKRKAVDLDGTGVYSALTYEHPDWMRFNPGSNSLSIQFDNGGDAATATFYWNDTFRS